MSDDEMTQPKSLAAVGGALQHRLSRRTLFKGAGGLGIGALTLGLTETSPAMAWGRGWPPTIPATRYGAEVVTEWFELILKLFHTSPGFSVLPATRAFGYIGVTLYEALVPGMPGYNSLAGRLNGLQAVSRSHDHAYHWPIVANHALAASARVFFRMTPDENMAALDELEASIASRLEFGVPQGIVRRSAARGRMVAKHIVDWAATDGGHDGHLTNFPADYIPPVGPGLWVPTPPALLSAFQPRWGANRPFVLTAAADYDPGPPPAFSTDPGSAFYAEALEVYQSVNTLTDEQRAIALFWADPLGPTVGAPGHWLSILNQVIEERDANLAEAAEAYAKAGMAVADALIGCYHTKYRYNLLRPISYIQQHIDAGWGSSAPVGTPPFPEYTSAHSVGTRAFTQVLFDLFGDMPFTDHTHDAIGLTPRSYSSWFGMAEETAISRLYGGIHFRSAIERGIEQGQRIGEQVSAL